MMTRTCLKIKGGNWENGQVGDGEKEDFQDANKYEMQDDNVHSNWGYETMNWNEL